MLQRHNFSSFIFYLKKNENFSTTKLQQDTFCMKKVNSTVVGIEYFIINYLFHDKFTFC